MLLKGKFWKGVYFIQKKKLILFLYMAIETTLYTIQIMFQKLKKSQLTYNHIYVEKFRHKKTLFKCWDYNYLSLI